MTSDRFRWIALACLLPLIISATGETAFGSDSPNVARGFSPEKSFDLGEIDHVNVFNGNLVVAIPLGITYTVSSQLSYQFSLVYNSNVWEGLVNAPSGVEYEATVASMFSNAGLGWYLGFGRLLHPGTPDYQSGGFEYAGSDGHEVKFWNTLHEEDTDEAGDNSTLQSTMYTRDGSYLRLRRMATTCVPASDPWNCDFEIDFPSGVTHHFRKLDGLPTALKDQFGNEVTITYDTNTWTVSDGFRTHTITFASQTYDPSSRPMVSQVALAAFGGAVETYSFSYGTASIPRGCPDTDPLTPDNPTVSFLAGISSTTGFTLSMPVPTSYDMDGGVECNQSGTLLHLGLPTGGALEWDFGSYTFPIDSEPQHHWAQRTAGVIKRRTKRSDATTEGEWQYVPEQHAGIGRCSGPNFPSRALKRTLVTPLGDKTDRYFSVWPCSTAASDGTLPAEYGLPLERSVTDAASGAFLSQETSDCDPNLADPKNPLNCSSQRRVFVKYELDGQPSSSVPTSTFLNQRLAYQKEIFVDDANSFKYSQWSDFDGLGHYRSQDKGGSLPGSGTRTETTNFNPGQGTYPGVNPANWVELDPLTTWVLTTFDRRTAQETVKICANETTSSQTSADEFCFNRINGELLRQRTIGSSAGTESANDVLRLLGYDASGNLTSEKWYGGDGASLAQGPLCTLTLPATTAYSISHTYQANVRATSQWKDAAEMPFGNFFVLNRTIDAPTGLPSSSSDISGLSTTFLYDGLGRLTFVEPSSASGAAWETYVYFFYTSQSSLARVRHNVFPNGNTTTPIFQEEFRFDGLGRLSRERRKREDDLMDDRYVFYNANGWKQFDGEWGRQSATDHTADYAVEYANQDPFGRPRSINRWVYGASPVTEATIEYKGEREVKRTTGVGTQRDPNTGVIFMESVSTYERRDSHGRLVEVEEPSGTSGQNVPSDYVYDVGNRLKRAVTSGQRRCWDYDQRGFLSSENHPELGASGNGSVTYLDYDPLGHAATKTNNGVTLKYTFDRAAREMTEREFTAGNRLLKEWTYATANAAPDYALGKVRTAKSYNYPVLSSGPTTISVLETFTYSGVGGRSNSRDVQVLDAGGSLIDHFAHSETFDPMGLQTSVTYPKCVVIPTRPQVCPSSAQVNRTVSSSYSNALLTSVSGFTNSISYNPNRLWASITRPNGVTDVQGAPTDRRARPGIIKATNSSATLFSTGTFVYDYAGNITALGEPDPLKGELNDLGGVERFQYDRVQRLVEGWVTIPARVQNYIYASQSYQFDMFGNIDLVTYGFGDTHNTHTSQTTNRMDIAGAAYDNRGNLTSLYLTSYSYDGLDRLVRREVNGEPKYHFLYAADDERLLVFVDTPINVFHYTLRDLSGRLLREYKSTASGLAVERDTVWRGSQVAGDVEFSVPSTPVSNFFTLDHLGSPRIVTSSAGSLMDRREYYPFGEAIVGDSQVLERTRFTGHERDYFNSIGQDDDLDYFHARFRSPLTGRFLSVDPVLTVRALKQPQAWNRYSYVIGNPLKYIDPYGELWFNINGHWTYLAGVSQLTSESTDASGNTTVTVLAGRGTFVGFNGGQLTLYGENGSRRSYQAVSGRVDSLGRSQPELQREARVGPIPEGRYSFNPALVQNYDRHTNLLDKLAGVLIGRGGWRGGRSSWGNQRVELTADPSTNTYGRSGFYIHGGSTPGSAGCIDLAGEADDFFSAVGTEAGAVDVEVDYP